MKRIAKILAALCLTVLLASCESFDFANFGFDNDFRDAYDFYDEEDPDSDWENHDKQLSPETIEALNKAAQSMDYATQKFTPENEYYIGRSVAGVILSRYPLYNDVLLQSYLESILVALVANSSKPEIYNGYCIAVLDTDEINAFSTPGGHILITKGMIKCTSSEDELAAVIAHEIAHIQLGHGIKSIKTSRGSRAFADSINAASSIVKDFSPSVRSMVMTFETDINSITESLFNKGYSKESEYQADRYAVSLLYKTGYYPMAIDNMLITMNRNETQGTGMAKTHPTPYQRMEKLDKEFRKYRKAEDNRRFRQDRFEQRIGTVGR